MNWPPKVTVATLVHRDGRFLLVYEQTDQGPAYNQPAGHLDPGETLLAAAVRETREETGWHVTVQSLLGVTLYRSPVNQVTYLRTSFIAEAVSQIDNAVLDEGIIEAVWLTVDEVRERQHQLRSPMVLNDIERFLAGQKYPLEIIESII